MREAAEKMILYVRADGREVNLRFNAQLLQDCCVSNPGELKELRRLDGP
jgi:hypothetical protein